MNKTKLAIIIILTLATILTMGIWYKVEYHNWTAELVESPALVERTINISDYMRGLEMRSYSNDFAMKRIEIIWLLSGASVFYLIFKRRINQ